MGGLGGRARDGIRAGMPGAVTAASTALATALASAVGPVAGRVGAIGRRAVRWVAPLGWIVLGGGLLAWWAGVRWGWSELLALGGAALVLFVACLLLALGRARVQIDVDVDPTRVTVGDPATGRVTVTNTGRTPLLPLLVELPVGVSAARFLLPPIGAGGEHEELFVVPTQRRGVIPVGPARTVQGDPLGLVRRTVDWTEVTELFVHPRTVALESLGAGLLRDLEGAVTEDQSLSDLAFHALREYQPGDDRRYIHWRSSAKAGRLLVRQFLDTRRSHVAVLVDIDPTAYRDGAELTGGARETTGGPTSRTTGRTTGRTVPIPGSALPEIRDLETAISVAASIALRAHRDEQDLTVVAGRHTVSKGTPMRTLDTLARIEPALGGPEAVPLRTMATTAVALAPDTSIAVVVTGPHRDVVELQRASGQFGPDVRTVVIVVDPLAERGIRHGAGLTLLTVDALRSLRVALAAGVGAA